MDGSLEMKWQIKSDGLCAQAA